MIPTDAERRRNRIYGGLTRARNTQLKARIDRDSLKDRADLNLDQRNAMIVDTEYVERCATNVIDKLLDDLHRPAPKLAPVPVVDATVNIGGYVITQPAAAQAARLDLSLSELLNVLNNGHATQIGSSVKWSIAGKHYILTIHPTNSTILAVTRSVTSDLR